MTRFAPLAVIAALAAAPAFAEAEKYTLDSSHSQIVFSYNHLGYSTSYGMFSGFGGEVVYDAENPAASTVSVTFTPTRSDTLLFLTRCLAVGPSTVSYPIARIHSGLDIFPR